MNCWRGVGILICVVCSFVRTARAQGNQVLFLAKERTDFSARVRAEIDAMGFKTVASDELDQHPPFAAVATAYVIETPPPRRIELWLPNPTSGHLELSTTIETSAGEDDASQTVRASEQLRAFFQPLRARILAPTPEPPVEAPPAPPPPAPAPPPAAPVPPRIIQKLLRPPQRFSAELALGLPLEPGGPGLDAVIRGHWVMSRRFGVGAVIAIPVLGSTVHATDGSDNSAAVSATLAGTELSMTVVDWRRLKVLTRGGIALAWVRAVGDATNPYSDKTDSALVGLPFVGAEIGLRLTERFQLCMGGDVGDALPAMQVVFSREPVAKWGRPFGLLTAGLRVGF